MLPTKIAQYAVPLAIVGTLGITIIPLPTPFLDVLLVANLLASVLLFGGALTTVEPLKLATFPSLLLLTTVFRLALNISTSRSILSTGYAGETVAAFGGAVIQDNVVVGIVLFALITLVQFIVVAKGAERVAEVSARFTLDALPGKQMSIDADVRAGLIDFETARKRRNDIQSESRFYGALDGAMKFVKGDAIAGIVIVLVNIIAGFVIGMMMKGMSAATALATFTLLTVGDGLLSQIPSILTAVGAGLVVTRVVQEEPRSLAQDLCSQIGQLSAARTLAGIAAVILSFVPGMPTSVCLGIGALLLFASYFLPRPALKPPSAESTFRPRLKPLLLLKINPSLAATDQALDQLREALDESRSKLFERWGISLPEFAYERAERSVWLEVHLRGALHTSVPIDCDGTMTPEKLGEIVLDLLEREKLELVDNLTTRRLLALAEESSSDLVATTIPAVLSVTMLSDVLRRLIAEGISIINIDLILQTVALHGTTLTPRALMSEIRIQLRARIMSEYAKGRRLRAYIIEPIIDMALVRAESDQVMLGATTLDALDRFAAATAPEKTIVLSSKRARMYLRDLAEVRWPHLVCLAHEELAKDTNLECKGYVELTETDRENVVEALAA